MKARTTPTLYPYQRDGVLWLAHHGFRGVLADEQGLGKTPTTLTAINEYPMLLPAVVVCPTALVGNWVAEIQKWCPRTRIAILEGQDDDLPMEFDGILLVGWHILEHYTRLLRRWKPALLVADEAHAAKNQNAARSEALEAIAKKARHVILLTGTPLVNMHADLWALVNFIKPGALGDLKDFRQICREDPGRAKSMIDNYVLRRLFVPTVGDSVPEKRRETIAIPENMLPTNFRKEYKKVEQEFETWLRAHVVAQLDKEYKKNKKLYSKMTSEKLAEIEARLKHAIEYEALIKQGKLRVLVGKAKVRAVFQWILSHIRKHEPVVVFAEHQDVFAELEWQLNTSKVPFVTIYGSNSGKAHEVVSAFQNGRVRVLLGSRAACQGLTLTRSNRIAFLERYWTSKDEEQAESRIHRLTQTRPCTITRFMIPNTMDERMDELVKAKETLARELLGMSEAETA